MTFTDKLREALERLDKQRASGSEPGAVDFATVVEDGQLDVICAAARLVLAAKVTSTDELREFIVEQIRDGYDRAPDDYKPGDCWDDGAERIADAIIFGPLTELVWERDVLRMANAKIPEALSDTFRAGAEAMQEKLKQFCEGNISVRGVHGARQAPYWRGCLEAIMDAELPTRVDD